MDGTTLHWKGKSGCYGIQNAVVVLSNG